MNERFQAKNLNRDDHKTIDKTADGIRKGVGALGILGLIATGVVKFGKPIAKVAKNLIIK